ncbi:MAG TPA: Xaa-Pro peptidase family protein [bacterium]|nr:Xaa-Pro peptidase family protein [bacterium]HQO91522.1 Xaa-Pro peptidase family protein [bacterium]
MFQLFNFSELNSRVLRFAKYLETFSIDCAVLTSNQDIFYFTGSVQKGTLIIKKEGECVYFVRKNLLRAQVESPQCVKSWDTDGISSMIKGTWSLPLDVTTVSEYLFYKKKFALEKDPADCSLPLSLTKMIKSDSELELMKKAGIMNQSVMEHAKNVFRQGDRDIDIQAEIEKFAKKELGHQGLFWVRGANMEASMGLVVTGDSALAPTYTDFPIGGIGLSPAVAQGASGEVIKNSFVIDFVGCQYGYCADSTRTFFIGEPAEKIKKTYEELNGYLNNIKCLLVPGKTGEEIYAFALKELEKYSWKANFMGNEQKVKFIGHGIGTEVNQLPVVAEKQKIPLENNMVIALEPKVFLPGYGIIGIENTFVIKDEAPLSITGECDNIEDFII